ncbi:hypothetical protein JCM31271_17160 [Halorubrum trueperi]
MSPDYVRLPEALRASLSPALRAGFKRDLRSLPAYVACARLAAAPLSPSPHRNRTAPQPPRTSRLPSLVGPARLRRSDSLARSFAGLWPAHGVRHRTVSL